MPGHDVLSLYTETVLENPRSPRVRAVAKLTKRSARQETGLFLLEGPQAAREALAYRPDTIVEVFATPSALEEALFYDHPAVGVRIRRAMDWKAAHPPTPKP